MRTYSFQEVWVPKTQFSRQISSFAEGDLGAGARDVWAAAD
jgi:hypothetical protein